MSWNILRSYYFLRCKSKYLCCSLESKIHKNLCIQKNKISWAWSTLQACDWGIFKKTELDIVFRVSCRPHHIWGRKEEFWFLHPLGCWKMDFLKPGKYSIINKFTPFPTFCHPYLKSLIFTWFLHEFQYGKFLKFFFSENQNSGINQKNHMSDAIWLGNFVKASVNFSKARQAR